MRLLICEYVTGGGFAGAPLPPGLAREGDMMLSALVKDVAALDGIDIAVVRDSRLAAMEDTSATLPRDDSDGLHAQGASFDKLRTRGNRNGTKKIPHPELVEGRAALIPGSCNKRSVSRNRCTSRCRVIRVEEDPWAVWRAAIEEVDAVWPIAPETGGALSRLSELVVNAGRTLFGSRPPAVSLATSKRETAERLAAYGIPVVPTVRAAEVVRGVLPDSSDGWVVKPDDGAGAEATRLFRRADDLRHWLASSDTDKLVVQPYLSGEAASLSVLCQDGRGWLLSCNLQDVVLENDAFRFRGCVVGGLKQHRPIYVHIAATVAAAIPDLWGYVGIDLIGRDSGPIILEVNPRLTTSYVALRAAIGINPAQLVLRLLHEDLAAVERPLRIRPQCVDVGTLDAA